jgi:hypothetical protein
VEKDTPKTPGLGRLSVQVQSPWSLLVASALAFLLVVLCGVTIGLIQFQSRLQSEAPTASISEIASKARIDRLLQDERGRYERLSDEAREASINVFVREIEIGARINRVCTAVNFEGPANALCYSFLQNIPFNQPPQGILPFIRSFYSSVPTYNPEGMLEAAVAVLKISDDTRKKMLIQHSHEIEPIAEFNVELENDLRPRQYRKYREQVQVCEKIRELSLVLETSAYPVSTCALLAAQANAALYRPIDTGGHNQQFTRPKDFAPPTIPESRVDSPPQLSVGNDNNRLSTATAENAPEGNFVGTKSVGADTVGSRPDAPATTTEAKFGWSSRQAELVSQYLFYQVVSFGFLSTILQSPADFLSFFLVGLSGMVGGLLRVILAWTSSYRSPRWRDLLVIVLLGLICSLIIYSLFRGGFMVISNSDQKSASSGLNPFVVSLLGVASGLLSDRAITRFKSVTDTFFGPDDPDQDGKWGIGLKSAFEPIPIEERAEIAKNCEIDPGLLETWISETEKVPRHFQDILSAVLKKPRRELFTSEDPA